MTRPGPPDTAFTSLLRHLVDNEDRTRRAAKLVVVTVLALAAATCLFAVVVAFVGASGLGVGLGATAAAGTVAVRAARSHRRHQS